MGRKKKGHQWAREDQGEVELRESRGRPDRAALRIETWEMDRLGKLLGSLTEGRRRALPLSPLLQEEIDRLAACGLDGARRRQRRRVVALLRDFDRGPLMAALEGDKEGAPPDPRIGAWRSRLDEEGDEGIQALVEGSPLADRVRLRTLLREASAPGARGQRAERRLRLAIAQALGEGGGGEE